MKVDEQRFYEAMRLATGGVAYQATRQSAFEIAESLGIHHKRAAYLLNKWGAYDYGTSMAYGWFTTESNRAHRTATGTSPA